MYGSPDEEHPGADLRRGAEIEYRAVRDEILARIRMRQQLIALTLALAGAFLGVGIANPPVALLYPPLAAFLAAAWAQNDFRVRDLAGYIRTILEPALPGIGWESRMHQLRRQQKGLRSWRLVVLSGGGVFLFTQALALSIGVVGLLTGRTTPPLQVMAWVLVGLDAVAVCGVVWLVRGANR